MGINQPEGSWHSFHFLFVILPNNLYLKAIHFEIVFTTSHTHRHMCTHTDMHTHRNKHYTQNTCKQHSPGTTFHKPSLASEQGPLWRTSEMPRC